MPGIGWWVKQRQGKYRIPNPEMEELENTILKMATKRAEVDAAQSLPGVGTALARIFTRTGEAVKDNEWTGFWSRAKAMGLEAHQVHELLGVNSMKEWQTQGRMLNDAIGALSEILAEQKKEAELW